MSFGSVALDYHKWRPGPSSKVAEWLIPEPVDRAVDLGAGTGAMTRLLLDRARHVVAVEPDPRMREVLTANVPGATVLEGRGEKVPLDDSSSDAVIVSSAWHWMDAEPTLHEVGRVLRPGGLLGVAWSGVDWRSDELAPVRALMRRGERQNPSSGMAEMIKELPRDRHTLDIIGDAPFAAPERGHIEWRRSLSAEHIVGMLGTFSRVVLLPDDEKEQIYGAARKLLAENLGVRGDDEVELPFRAECWRARRL